MKKLLVGTLLCWHLVSNAQVDRDEFKCLAQVVYIEARGEPIEGKLAVAQVVLNRLKLPNYPKTICGILHQPGQFQWVKKYSITLPDYQSYLIARDVILGHHKLSSFTGTHFHSRAVHPHWKYKKNCTNR